jgi:Polyketide cyclase / dehydrase and lipid transport
MDHIHSTHVAADPDSIYAVLSDPSTLAQFIPQMTAIDRDGDRVQVEARYGGHTQHGEASFTADASARKVQWGADSGYRGWLQVEPHDTGAMLTLGLTTTHTEATDHDVAGTLDAIRRLVEARVCAPARVFATETARRLVMCGC